MNTISKYITYLGSMFFGYAQVFIFTSNMSNVDMWATSILFFIVWLSLLLRIGCLLGNKGQGMETTMNKISKYAVYLSSLIFGSAQVVIFMSNMPDMDKWTLSILLFIVWFSPLVRVGYLSSKR